MKTCQKHLTSFQKDDIIIILKQRRTTQMKKTIYQYTWLNGCVTYGQQLTDEERAEKEQRFGKLVRQVVAF